MSVFEAFSVRSVVIKLVSLVDLFKIVPSILEKIHQILSTCILPSLPDNVKYVFQSVLS